LLLLLLYAPTSPAASPKKAVTTVAALQAPHCYQGCPTLKPQWQHGMIVQVARAAYALDESTATKVPVWVAEYVTAAEVTGDAERGGFAPDPLLTKGDRAELADYRGSGWDRGHQAPAGNHKASQARMDETFYLSNMCPQQPEFNRQFWRELEERTRAWVRERGEAYEITGPIFWNGKAITPKYAYETIGADQVAIPTHFYKIIVAPVERGSTEYEAIAFLAENRAYQRPFHFDHFIRSVADIEALTGLDFMPNLKGAEWTRLEKTEPDLWPVKGHTP
jgi:endonuclease G, mitochondrial